MTDLAMLDCLQPEKVTLERVRYFQGQLLTAEDLQAEQAYFLQKQRRHNRFLHGWGAVCGLEVTAAPTDQLPLRVRISAGYALGPYGNEINVAEPVFLDLAQCGPGAITDPCDPRRVHAGESGVGATIFVAIKYAECLARPVKAMPPGCACDEEDCEYTRIRDSFQIQCLPELPPSHEPDPDAPNLCDLVNGRRLAACPPCPSDPWVVLAQVTLPVNGERISSELIDNFTFRRQVLSSAILQRQLFECCCEADTDTGADLRVNKEFVERSGLAPVMFFEITIANNGPDAAENIVLIDSVPEGIVINQASFQAPVPGLTWEQTTPQEPLRATIDRLEAGESVTVQLGIERFQGAGTFVNEASVSSDTRDPDLSNNTDTAEVNVPEPDIT